MSFTEWDFAATRREARQLVVPRSFSMSTAKRPISLPWNSGKGDVITVKDKSKDSPKFKQLRDMVSQRLLKWVTIDTDKLEGKIVAYTFKRRYRCSNR